MIQPQAFLLQQQVALKTARQVAVARSASFADFLPATDKIRAKVRAVRPPFVQTHFGFPRFMNGKDPFILFAFAPVLPNNYV
jgi:hypothetical protein